MHQQGTEGSRDRDRDRDRDREQEIGREREEYGGGSPNMAHISSGTQSLGYKHDRRGIPKGRALEEDSLSLPPILPASAALDPTARHPMDKKRNRSGGTASAPSRLRYDAASSLKASATFEGDGPSLPTPIRVSHDYGSPNGTSPIFQNNSGIVRKVR